MAFDFVGQSGFELSSRTAALNKIDEEFGRQLDMEDRAISHQMREIGLAEAERRHSNALREDALREEARLQQEAFLQEGINMMKDLDPEDDNFIEDYGDLVTSLPTGALAAPQFKIMSETLLERNKSYLRQRAQQEAAAVKRNDALTRMVLPALTDAQRITFMDKVSSGVPLSDAIDDSMGDVFNNEFGKISTGLAVQGFSDEFIESMAQGFENADRGGKASILQGMQNILSYEEQTDKKIEAELKMVKPYIDKAKADVKEYQKIYNDQEKHVQKLRADKAKLEDENDTETKEYGVVSDNLKNAEIVLGEIKSQKESAQKLYDDSFERYNSLTHQSKDNIEITSGLNSPDPTQQAQARWMQIKARGEAKGLVPTPEQINKYPELKIIKDGLDPNSGVNSGTLDINNI